MQEEEPKNLHSRRNTTARKKQETPALVEFIVFTEIGPMGYATLRTHVFTIKHEIL